MIVSMNLNGATYKQKEYALTTLFISLSKAIRDYGCQVDITNPDEIKIWKEYYGPELKKNDQILIS